MKLFKPFYVNKKIAKLILFLLALVILAGIAVTSFVSWWGLILYVAALAGFSYVIWYMHPDYERPDDNVSHWN